MRETLPDILVDDRVPAMFLAGFSLILLAMIIALVSIAITRNRARKAGIYRKYVVSGDRTNHRRAIDLTGR